MSGRWIDRSARLSETGLLRGERLSLVVGLRPGGATGFLDRWPERRSGDATGRVGINRPPRAVTTEPELSIAVPTKQRHRPPRRFPLGAMLIPLGIGLLLVLVTRRLEIALFSLFTPVMVLWNYIEERRARADELRDFGRTYEEEVAATLDRVRDTSSSWGQWLHQHYPAPDETVAITRSLSPRLWERQPGDPDFLKVRMGLATRRAPITLRQDESSRLRVQEDQPDYEGTACVDGLPAVVDLAAGPLAVVSPPERLEGLTAWLVTQVTALHSPSHVAIAGAFSEAATCDWFRWLPHVAPRLAAHRRGGRPRAGGGRTARGRGTTRR